MLADWPYNEFNSDETNLSTLPIYRNQLGSNLYQFLGRRRKLCVQNLWSVSLNFKHPNNVAWAIQLLGNSNA